MSVTDHRPVSARLGPAVSTEAQLVERRPTLTPRRSWSSDVPFESAASRTRTPAASRWRSVRYAFVARALATDLVLAVAIPTLLFFVLHGVTLYQLAWGTSIGLLVVAMIAIERGYDPTGFGDGTSEFRAVVRGGVLTGAVLALLSVGFDVDVPRTVLFGGVPLLIVALGINRYAARVDLNRRRARGEAVRATLVVGDRRSAEQAISDLRGTPYYGYDVLGVCIPDLPGEDFHADVPVLGTVSDTPQVVVDGGFDVVIVVGSALSGEALRRLSWALDRAGAELVVAPGLVEVFGPRLALEPTAGLSLLHVRTMHWSASQARLKRIFDIVAASAALVLLAPVMAAAATAVRLSGPGPILFRQTRVAKDGATFSMLKFRTMVPHAEDLLSDLRSQNDADGPLFKLEKDPRVTPIGRFLRKHSIDELPQLLNVLRGEMSLVGPRPPLPSEVDAYREPARRRLLVKPGLTGLWQINGRADLSWSDSVRLDLRYVENWSFGLDLTILLKTVRVVLEGRGGR